MKTIIDEITEKAQDLIAVPHCYGELKDKAKSWIDSINTSESLEKAKAFVKELEEDVMSIDDLINFSESKDAIDKFGKEIAEKIHNEAIEAKAKGEKYCTCAACKAGAAILELKDKLIN